MYIPLAKAGPLGQNKEKYLLMCWNQPHPRHYHENGGLGGRRAPPSSGSWWPGLPQAARVRPVHGAERALRWFLRLRFPCPRGAAWESVRGRR